MSKRRAPKDGYLFPAKEEYRRRVWNAFARNVTDPQSADVLLLPSLEGREIEIAMEKGFQEPRLHVVDDNPAIVATLKKRFPQIQTYGVTASAACRRIAAKGIKLRAANFDFTASLSHGLTAELEAIRDADCFADDFCVALTVLRGRDTILESSLEPFKMNTLRRSEPGRGQLPQSKYELGYRDWYRLALLGRVMPPVVTWSAVMATGIYMSPSNQTMLWFVERAQTINRAVNPWARRAMVQDRSDQSKTILRNLQNNPTLGDLAEVTGSAEGDRVWEKVISLSQKERDIRRALERNRGVA